MISKELIAILCCPICQSKVQIDEENAIVKCTKCHNEFLIKDNIPIMIQQQTMVSQQTIEEHGK